MDPETDFDFVTESDCTGRNRGLYPVVGTNVYNCEMQTCFSLFFVQVFKHERLGQSKEEFLQLNSAHLAACSHVIILLSTAAATSLFVYNEVLFADWLGKPFVVAMAANSWDKLRPNMQAILGSCPAVNFEGDPYEDNIDILLYHLKPFRNMPAVILEQDFLDRMVEGLKPLRVLAALPGRSNKMYC